MRDQVFVTRETMNRIFMLSEDQFIDDLMFLIDKKRSFKGYLESLVEGYVKTTGKGQQELIE